MRDPRIDPRPGDVVGDRKVCEVTAGGLVVYRLNLKRGKLSSLHYVGDSSWRCWAEKQEVLHAAD